MAKSPQDIQTVTVIGAGVMGGGIAGLFANAGYKVHLLDIPPPNDPDADRDLFAKTKLKKMVKASAGNPASDPFNATFLHPSLAKNIIPGNSEDNLQDAVTDSDLVIEVIPEVLELKHNLYERIEKAMNEGTIVTSNTSSIQLDTLAEGRSEQFKKNFALTHFFNPPRFMRLLEVVRGPETDPDVMDTLIDLGDKVLGQKMIEVNDEPGLAANRLGVYFMFRTLAEAQTRNLRVEDVDAVMSKPLGLGKAGPFKVLDQVGIGLTPHLAESLLGSLHEDDDLHKISVGPTMSLTDEMIQDGRTGRQSETGAGFYRLNRLEDGTKLKEVLDLGSRSYRPVEKKKLESVKAGRKGPRAVFEAKDHMADFAWDVMRDTLLYAAKMLPSVTDNLADIDTAMKDGYGWKKGPFEMMDEIGHDWLIERAKADGVEIPPALELASDKPFYIEKDGKVAHMTFDFDNESTSYETPADQKGVLSLEEIKKTTEPLIDNPSASLWDLGDGVACFEFHSKMNTIDPFLLLALNQSIKLISDDRNDLSSMVIYNEGSNFSSGANLGVISKGFEAAAKNKFIKGLGLSKPLQKLLYNTLDDILYEGQSIYEALREAPFPVVGAPKNMALGGGAEILLHCDAIQAHRETYMALPESGLGVLPAWGGATTVLRKAHEAQKAGHLMNGPFPPVKKAFEIVTMPHLSGSTSAVDAKKKMWLTPDDGVTMNHDRLLADAKKKAIEMVPGYKPPEPATFSLPGKGAATAFKTGVDGFYAKGLLTYHDMVVADAIGELLSGDDTHIGLELSESDMKQLERDKFMSLIHLPETKARIAHTLGGKGFLREAPLEENKSVDEIRAVRKEHEAKRREITGQPLSGKEEKKLRRYAEATQLAMEFESGNWSTGKTFKRVKQIIKPSL